MLKFPGTEILQRSHRFFRDSAKYWELIGVKGILQWIAQLFCGITAFVGALLAGRNAIEIIYLATGKIQPDFDQPPLTVVVSLLIFGLILLLAGWALHKTLRNPGI